MFGEFDREGFRVVGINKGVVYFVNGKEVFPFLKLNGVLDNFGVEFFGDAVEGDAVVGGEDEFLFEIEGFLEFFDAGEEVYDLGGDVVDEGCGFEPIVTIC